MLHKRLSGFQMFFYTVGLFFLSIGCLPPPLPEDPPEVTIALERNLSANPQQPNQQPVFRSGFPIVFTLSVKNFRIESKSSHLHKEHTSFEKATGGYAKVFLGDRFLYNARSKRFVVIPPRFTRGKQTVSVELVDHDGQSFTPKIRSSLDVQLR